jgi:peptide/nickel transport system permease protein
MSEGLEPQISLEDHRVEAFPSESDSESRNRAPRVRRVGWLVAKPILLMLIVSFVIVASLSLSPGDPVSQLAGPRATPEQVEAVRAELGLDKPLLTRYADWVMNAVQGDFGRSIISREPVTDLLAARMHTTIFLILYSAVLILVFGIGFGMIGGAFPKLGPVVAGVSALCLAIPAFVAAPLLISLLSLRFDLFPTTGTGSGFVDRLYHLTLPSFALAIGWSAYVSQITRVAIREESLREHVVTARNRGASKWNVFRRHVLRNAAMPIITISGLMIAGLVAGTVVVESAFGINGVGSLLSTSVSSKDFNVVQAISVIIVLVFVVTTTVIDILHRRLDPRVRGGG